MISIIIIRHREMILAYCQRHIGSRCSFSPGSSLWIDHVLFPSVDRQEDIVAVVVLISTGLGFSGHSRDGLVI